MHPEQLKDLLTAVSTGSCDVDAALAKLRNLPFEDAGVAMIDHHRTLRQGLPEVVYGEGKTSEQLVTIIGRMIEHGGNVLSTRLAAEKGEYPPGYLSAGRITTLWRVPLSSSSSRSSSKEGGRSW